MKAWLIDEIGSLTLRQGTLPEPSPEPGQVVVRLRFAGLNPADRYLAEGAYPASPPMPHVLGRDGAGEIEAVGESVDLEVGSRVMVLRGDAGVSTYGTFAERVVAPVDYIVPTPEEFTDQHGAAIGVVYLTALQAMTQFGQITPGSFLLITGASGGVGTACIQMAPTLGLRAIALSRSEAKRKELAALGAELTLDPEDRGWPKQVRAFTGDAGVQVAVDNIGGPKFNDLLKVMGMHGGISAVGRLAGPVPEFNTASLFFRRIAVKGVAVGTFTAAEARGAWDQCLAALRERKQLPIIDQVFDFDQLPEAFARLKAGPMGKVLLRIG